MSEPSTADAKPTINVGELKTGDQGLHFKGTTHSGGEAVTNAFFDSHKKLTTTLEAKHSEYIGKLIPEQKAAFEKAWTEFKSQSPQGFVTEKINDDVMKFITEHSEHAAEDFKGFKTAREAYGKVHNEILGEKQKFVSDLLGDTAKRDAFLAENKIAKEELEKLAAGLKQEAKLADVLSRDSLINRHFGGAKVHGWGAQINKTMGLEAWKNAPVKTGFRTAGIVASLGAAYDAVARGQYKDKDGNLVDRSKAVRVGQLFTALGTGTALALHGGI